MFEVKKKTFLRFVQAPTIIDHYDKVLDAMPSFTPVCVPFLYSLEGLLLLNLSRGGEGEGKGASLSPRARLQLPTVPIQAGFLAGDLVVALPSSSSTE